MRVDVELEDVPAWLEDEGLRLVGLEFAPVAGENQSRLRLVARVEEDEESEGCDTLVGDRVLAVAERP
jgi:hypothetical protein